MISSTFRRATIAVSSRDRRRRCTGAPMGVNSVFKTGFPPPAIAEKRTNCSVVLRISGFLAAISGNRRGLRDVYRTALAPPARLLPRGKMPESKGKGSCFLLSGWALVTRAACHNSASCRQRNVMGRKTFQRNQLIVLASQNGATTMELSRHFSLAKKSIVEIIRNERHRLAVSPDPIYRALRKSVGRGTSTLQ